LFHSFQEFNVGQGRSVYFANPAQIQNILSRVTGGNASNILGRLGVLGSANLFLINPNGIIFGPNSSLDIQGSFFATTADGIKLGDKGFFSATEPGKSDLLSVSPGALFFNQAASQAGNIINRGNLAVGGDLTLAAGNLDLQGQLLSGGNLTLQALDGVKIRDTVESPFVVAAVGDLLIQGNNIDIFTLNNPKSALVSYGNLTLKSPNPVIGDAHYYSGGNFRIEQFDGNLGDLYSPSDPVIRSLGDVSFDTYQGASLHIIAAGSVNIPNSVQIIGADSINGIAETITLSDGTTVNIDGQNRPTLDIRAGVDSTVVGDFFFNPSDYFPFNPNSSSGIFNPNLGDFPILSQNPTSSNINIGSVIFADFTLNPLQSGGTVLITNQYQPNPNLSGNIQITPTLNDLLPGVAVQTSGFNNGGLVVLDSKGSTIINGTIQATVVPINVSNSLVFLGNGGDVTVLSQDNITFASSPFAGINSNGLLGGNIILKSQETISLSGGFVNAQSFSTDSNLKGGNIEINAKNLIARQGTQINTITLGQAEAGDLTITILDSLDLIGTAPHNSQLATSLSTQPNPGATGNGGTLTISTNKLNLTDGAEISASTFGGGARAGNINIFANDSVEVKGTSNDGIKISRIVSQAENDSGTAGDITITTGQLFVREGANLSTTSFGTGDTGNMIISADSIEINGIFSTIAGFNFAGEGGEININTNRLQIFNGASVQAGTRGAGKAGNLIINASDSVEVIGTTPDVTMLSTLATQSFGEGNAGDLVINTQQLFVSEGGQVTTRTRGAGNAGNLIVNASEAIEIRGKGQSPTSLSNLSSQSDVTLAGNAGNVTVTTQNLLVENNGFISTATLSDNSSGTLTITTGNLTIRNGGRVLSGTSGRGNGGNISIVAEDSIEISGTSADGSSRSEVSAKAISNSTGNAGTLEITSKNLLVENGGEISSETFGEGDGGNITIDTEQLTVKNGGSITTKTNSAGNSGELVINASESIRLIDERQNIEPLQQNVSLISSQADINSTGKANNLTITTKNLLIQDGGTIDASTFGTGNAGTLTINASDSIEIMGVSRNFFAVSQVSSGTTNDGNGGILNINTRSLTIQDGAQISVATLNSGEGGTLNVNASELIEIKGKSSITDTPSNLSATAVIGSTGNAGNLNITTQLLKVSDEAQISASTSNAGNAGNITINASLLTLSDSAGIQAFTQGEGTAGNITINAPDSIILNSDTKLIVETSNAGTAGNININTPLLTIGENAQLSATATATSTAPTAGNINLNVNQLNISGELGIFAETNSTPTAGSLTIHPYENNPNLNIQFTENGFISARTTSVGDGGNITLTAPENIDISGLGSITAETSGIGNAGNINITTENLTIRDGVEIRANTSSVGDSGNIILSVLNLNLDNATIEALTTNQGNPGSILIINGEYQANQVNIANNSTISTEIRGEGNPETAQPANITINSENLSLTSSQITASTTRNRDAGNINLNNNQINLDNGRIIAITSGSGKGGEISIPNTQTLNLINNSGIIALTSGAGKAGNLNFNISESVTIDSGSFFNVETESQGKAGEIIITAPILTIGDNAELSARSLANATGEAGNITLTTNQLNISGELGIFAETESIANAGNLIINPLNNNPNLIINFFNKGKISASTLGDGDGGDINITAPEIINISGNGSIQVEANSSGDAGEIFINANNQINLSNGVNVSSLTSGNGKAGNINLTSENLNLTEGVTITASTTGDGDAGSINLSANNLNFNQTEINAVTNSTGNAGNILINYQQENAKNLTLTNSTISTEIQANGIANQPSNITIKTDNLNSENSTITASTRGKGNAGNIAIVDTENINLNNSNIIATTSGEGNTEEIELTANNTLRLNHSQVSSSVEENAIGNSQQITLNTPNLSLNQSNILAETAGQGNAGSIIAPNANIITLDNSTISTAIAPTGQATQPSNITLNTQQLTLDNNSQINATTAGKGDAGSITVPNAQQITLNQSEITASTSGEGDTGVIDLKATGNLNLANSQINSSVEQGAVGNSRQITLDTPNLSLNSSQINATTAGQGNAGSIIAPKANSITLDNSTISTAIAPTGQATQPSNITLNTQQLTLNNNSRITASTEGKGNAGNITVPNAQTISLDNNSQINASTSGEGNAGDIALKTQTVTLNNSSAITTTVNPNAIGRGGNITLQTTGNFLTLNNQSQISSLSQGQGNAGNILINSAGNVALTNSDISTSAEQASGGAITITASNLRLNGDSNLRTNVASGAGGGGDITLTAGSILAFGDSDILAFARDGKGGNITINTPIFFAEGFQPIPQDPNSLNGNNRVDINASGAVSGIITLPDLSFIPNSLIDLPENLIDTDNLIANSCVVPNRQKAGTFVITGSGGLPLRPGDASMSSYSTGTVRAVPDKPASSRSWQPGNPIIEPQGLYRLSNGQLVLSRECP
jgi:filamentous hemagglutinin family protein